MYGNIFYAHGHCINFALSTQLMIISQIILVLVKNHVRFISISEL